MAAPPRRELLALLLEEVQEERRSTEQKQLAVWGGYGVLVGASLAIVKPDGGGDLEAAVVGTRWVFGFLALVGGLVALQVHLLSNWKLHYQAIARRILEELAPAAKEWRRRFLPVGFGRVAKRGQPRSDHFFLGSTLFAVAVLGTSSALGFLAYQNPLPLGARVAIAVALAVLAALFLLYVFTRRLERPEATA